jgi:hypothetical protein
MLLLYYLVSRTVDWWLGLLYIPTMSALLLFMYVITPAIGVYVLIVNPSMVMQAIAVMLLPFARSDARKVIHEHFQVINNFVSECKK